MPPQGDELVTKMPGETYRNSNGGNAGGNIPCDLAELVELWPRLSHKLRAECLKMAQSGLVKHR